MNTKNLFSGLMFLISIVFYMNFVDAFKVEMVDDVINEHNNLQTAFERAQDQLSLNSLKDKKSSLTLSEVNILENFIPNKLNSGTFVYNLAQFANQNRLVFKSIQYSIFNDGTAASEEQLKRLTVEFTLTGRYEDFVTWVKAIENANTLVTIQSIRGVRESPNSDIIAFNVRFVVHAHNID